jgi:type IV pilus assembly protein PilM
LVLANQIGWIGVDIGTHTVKMAQVVRAGGGLRLRQAVVIQRPAPWPEEDSMVWAIPCASHDEMYAARNYGRFVGRSAASVLPMNVCELHGLTVPPGTDQERRTMIAGELAEYWSERPDPMQFGYWETDSVQANERAGGFNVNVLAVPQLWIERLTQDCRRSSLDCWSVDGCPLAMARAVDLVNRFRTERCVLAIDWGFSNVTLCIVSQRRPMYARKLRDCGVRLLLESICSTLGVTEDEAQHLLDTQGMLSPDADEAGDQELQAAITEAAYGTIESLLQQVQRTLQFVQTQRRYLLPSAIWLMGGGATMPNIGPYLTRKLDMPVHIWSMPTDSTELPHIVGRRSALFSLSAALSALAWRAA